MKNTNKNMRVNVTTKLSMDTKHEFINNVKAISNIAYYVQVQHLNLVTLKENTM